jgi:hypothetical protein
MDHEVDRLFRQRERYHVLLCTCGERITGQDQIECNRKFELHVIDHANEME